MGHVLPHVGIHNAVGVRHGALTVAIAFSEHADVLIAGLYNYLAASMLARFWRALDMVGHSDLTSLVAPKLAPGETASP